MNTSISEANTSSQKGLHTVNCKRSKGACSDGATLLAYCEHWRNSDPKLK